MKATETVLDYVVSQHGPEQIGPLFRGFMQYNSWEELVPAMFNISVTEFETGWREHIQSIAQTRQFSMGKSGDLYDRHRGSDNVYYSFFGKN